MANKGVEGGFKHIPQLFNVKTDKGETSDLSVQHPDLIKKMSIKINEIKAKNKRDKGQSSK